MGIYSAVPVAAEGGDSAVPVAAGGGDSAVPVAAGGGDIIAIIVSGLGLITVALYTASVLPSYSTRPPVLSPTPRLAVSPITDVMHNHNPYCIHDPYPTPRRFVKSTRIRMATLAWRPPQLLELTWCPIMEASLLELTWCPIIALGPVGETR